jgi:probable phosphoglycerate mutase
VPVELYLIRHGATAWSHTGQHTGRTDVQLLPDGEEQARRLGWILGGVTFDVAFSSDLQRALRTAELVGVEQPTVTPLLREVDYGEYEGLTTEEIWRDRPGWELFHDGCPGGETPQQVAARARTFVGGLAGVEGRVAIFSHGHFMRALATVWMDLDVRAAVHLGLDTAALGVLRDGSRGRVVLRWNWVPDPTAAATH